MKNLIVVALVTGVFAIPSASAMAGSARTVQSAGQTMTMPKHKVVKHHKVAGPHKQVIKPSEQN